MASCRPAGPAPTTTESTTTVSTATTQSAAARDINALLTDAQAEGTLTTIALPHDWCNYGGVIEGFKSKYGIDVTELAPDAGSAEALEAIRANQGSAGRQAPDVIDMWLSFGPEARAENLIAPYEVSDWNSLPSVAKDPDGYWYGGYYGALAFEVNSDVVETLPQTWQDLLDSQYSGQIALAGDPRVSNQAIFSVYAAALANGGSLDDARPGLDFFAQLSEIGNLSPAISESGTGASSGTSVTIRWTFDALANRNASADLPNIEVIVPVTGRLAGVYVQAISAYAPHPNAAKLWMEYLYSDEGQLLWLEGFCHPIRYDDLIARDAVPADLGAAMPDVSGASFPSLEQVTAATELITSNWDSVVGVDIGG